MSRFLDYKKDASKFITVQERQSYPEYLDQAVTLYEPVFERFGRLIGEADSSATLLRTIMSNPNPMRTQLLRLFRRCVSPDTSVEMLKVKARTEDTIRDFGYQFESLERVVSGFSGRRQPDEALAAILWEHHDRGKPGYALTENFFEWFQLKFPEEYLIVGPPRAGSDVQLHRSLPNFAGRVPADFVIIRRSNREPLVIGFGHYDSDRGGSQEDDRTAGNQDKVNKIMQYASDRRMPLKVLFLNDGPGLLLGSMWADYSELETKNEVHGEQRVLVVTFKMLEERLTKKWLEEGRTTSFI